MRIVLTGGLAPSMFENYRELVINYKKISIEELKEIVKNNEIINYIRHESTVRLLARILNRDLTPNTGLYKWRPSEMLIIVGLKNPQRGQEMSVTVEDLDLVLCRISVVK